METIGEKIRKLRRDASLSQEALAFDLDVTRQTISSWENDAKQPNSDNICALSEYFNVTTDYFFSLENVSTFKNVLANEHTEIINEEFAITKEKSAKSNFIVKQIFLILAIIFSSVIFIICSIISGILIYLSLLPPDSDSVTAYNEFNWGAIAIVVLALIALITLIIVIIAFCKNKKPTCQSKMTSCQQELADKNQQIK